MDDADNQTLQRLRDMRAEIAEAFTAMEARFDSMGARFDSMDRKLSGLVESLTNLHFVVEDLRGIVVQGFLEQGRIAALEAEVASLRADVEALKAGSEVVK